MVEDKKKDFPWETMDTTTLMFPEELIAYHIYRLLEEQKRKPGKKSKKDALVLASYLNRESSKKEENQKCFLK